MHVNKSYHVFIVDIFHVSVEQCLTIVQIALVSAFSGLSLVSCLISAVHVQLSEKRKKWNVSLNSNFFENKYNIAYIWACCGSGGRADISQLEGWWCDSDCVLIVCLWPVFLFPPRHHTTLCLLSPLLPAFHQRVHVVGMPPSYQSPWFQCTVCNGGLLHFWSPGVFVLVPEPAGPGPVPPTQHVGQVRL